MADRAEACAELAQIVREVAAYVEQHLDAGATGFPKGERRTDMSEAPAHGELDSAPLETSLEPAESHAAPRAARSADPEGERLRAPPPLPDFLGDPPGEPAAPPKAAPAPPPAQPTARLAPGQSLEHALSVIQAEVRDCTQCVLAETRTNTVFARGNPNAKLCFVGEAPGADEDAQGLPFVGRAGQLLDKMIAAMGLDPERDVYVCNIIKCRPPGNRRPAPEETTSCIGYLERQLDLMAPRVIVALGNTAASTLIGGPKIGITRLRGQWKLYRGKTLLMPTYHPSYLIRPSAQQKKAKREAWEDLQAVMKELGLEPSP